MKKFLFLCFSALLVFALAACGGGDDAKPATEGAEDSGDFESMEITFSHNQPLESPEHTGAEKFKEVVEEKTGGKVKVNVFPASQLGSLREQVEGTQLGEIHITMQPTAVVSPFVDDIKAVDLPYLWPADKEQTYEVLDGEVGKELLGTLDQGGFKGLGYWPGGFKLFTTGKKEIHKPEDFKGLTMRVMESPVLIEQYAAWGGKAIPVPYSEVYNSLQQGVVDGQENPLQTIFLNNYHEVQENIIQSYHGGMTYVLMANKPWFDGVSDNVKEVLAEAEEAGRTAAREKLAEVESDYLQKIKDSGVNYYELTEEEIAAFREASLPMHKKVYNKPEQLELLDKLYDAIEEAQK
jgi:C4-dicarboxylate-binding protein DctP